MQNQDHREASLQPGDVVADKYRVERVLGTGGMGVVVAALHLKLGERVAIKFLRAEAAVNVEATGRFEREARAAVRIKSEHVARVLDIGVLEDGASYIVMEHLEGKDLGRVVKERGPLPVAEAVGHILHACEALAEAHAMGIVHRDIKPANLFLTHRADGSPSVKVLDFGISKLAPALGHSGEATLTSSESFLGTPVYMAPEQMTDPRSADARADIWSLGATLYRLLTGKLPFEGDTMPALCGRILSGVRPASFAAGKHDLPAGLEAVVMCCLSHAPEARFANVGALAAALAEFGPPDGRLSASRAQRVLEVAGIAPNQSVPLPSVSIEAPATPAASSDVPTPSEIAAAAEAASQPKTAGTWSRQAEGGARKLGAADPNASLARGFAIAVGALLLLGLGVAVGFGARRPALASSSPEVAPAAPAALPSPQVAAATGAAPTVTPASTTPASASAEPPAPQASATRPAPRVPGATRPRAPGAPKDLFDQR